MATKNDITLDTLVTRVPSKEYLNNYGSIDFSIKLETPVEKSRVVPEDKPKEELP